MMPLIVCYVDSSWHAGRQVPQKQLWSRLAELDGLDAESSVMHDAIDCLLHGQL